MIRSTNLTALQTAMIIEPLTSKSQAAVSRPADWASLNPQPLPPKDVLGNVSSFGALNTKDPAAAVLNRFLTVNKGSSVATHVVSSQRVHRGADGAVQQKVAFHSTDSIVAAIKEIAAEQAKATAVDQLTKAEKMAEDAYNTLSNPGSNEVEKLRAREEWAKASALRAQASLHGLSPNQREALAKIEETEMAALNDATFAVYETKNGDQSEGWLREYARDFATADAEMQLGAEENQSLIKWVTSK